MVKQYTDADLEPYLDTPLVALYGPDVVTKRGLLATLSTRVGATYLGLDTRYVSVIGERVSVEVPPEMFDPLYSHPDDDKDGRPAPPQWKVQDGPLQDVIQWWLRRFGSHADESTYLTSLLLAGLSSRAVAVEHLERDLHPLQQHVLGDFLVALVRGGTRVIVETHSIQLLSRLRVWAAWDPTLRPKLGVWVLGSRYNFDTDQPSRGLTDGCIDDEVRVGVISRG